VDDRQPRLFRKVDALVEAMQLSEDNVFEVCEWSGGEDTRPDDGNVHVAHIRVGIKPDHQIVSVGDWLVKHTDGRFSRYRSSTFAEKFELADTVHFAELSPIE
jgi:hypothetical protein